MDPKVEHHPQRRLIRGNGYFKRLGPGIITGAADDDPSGIGTYSQVGANSGYTFVGTTVVFLPLAFAVQEACARIGLVTGRGLASVIKSQFRREVVWLAVITACIANIVNIAADLSSMAAVIRMFLPVPQLALVALLGFGCAAAEIVIPYQKYARVLKWLCLSLLSYLIVLAIVKIDQQALLAGISAQDFQWNRTAIATIIALAGTTISPYLFFWQTAEEVEETSGQPTTSPSFIRAMRLDVFAGMLSGIAVMFAIMATSAATMHQAGIFDITTPEQAASVLEPLAGRFATTIFALGILGTGLLAVPVLAGSTAYAISELFGWRDSLAEKPSAAKPFYATIALAIMLAVALNAIGINPMHSLLIAAQLNGLAAPLLLFLIWRTGRNRALMQEWRSPWWSSAILGLTFTMLTALPIMWLLS